VSTLTGYGLIQCGVKFSYLRIKNELQNYVVLKPSELPSFIQKGSSRLKPDTILKIIHIIGECSTKIVSNMNQLIL